MSTKENFDKIKKIAIAREQLKKNIDLKEHLMLTKDSISKETFDNYIKTYTENIEKFQAEVSSIESIINEIESSFDGRKINIETRMSSLEKVINETTTLYKSNAIDIGEYNKRKSENDSLLSTIEKDNRQLSIEIEELNSLKSAGETTSVKNKISISNSKIKFTKKNIIIFSSAAAAIIVISLVLIITKYSNVNFDGWGSDFKKQYPVRIPVVDNTLSYGFTDERGVIVIPPQFQSVHNFSEGLAAVRSGGKWGYINDRGALVVDYQFTSKYANDFSEGLVAVYKDKKWGYVDQEGNEVIPFEYDNARSFYLGFAPVQKDKKWGYIDKKNNVVVEFKYDDAYSYRDEGLAVVRLGNKRGYIDIKGDYVVDPVYDNVKAFTEGLAAVKKDGKWGYIDTKGEMYINNQYKNAYNFKDSLSVVATDNRLIIIDNDGNAILSTDYDNLINIGSSMFTGTYDSKFWQLLDDAGNIKIDNDNIISPIDIYGNGMIFRAKSPYGYTLYDSSFNHVMNYYFPYTGVYKGKIDDSNDEYREYYFFVWYKEANRKYYCFGIEVDESASFSNFLNYSELSIKSGKMTVVEENIIVDQKYDFYTDTYTDETSTNTQLYPISIDSDVLTIGEKSFERVYNFENTNDIRAIYSKEKEIY